MQSQKKNKMENTHQGVEGRGWQGTVVPFVPQPSFVSCTGLYLLFLSSKMVSRQKETWLLQACPHKIPLFSVSFECDVQKKEKKKKKNHSRFTEHSLAEGLCWGMQCQVCLQVLGI